MNTDQQKSWLARTTLVAGVAAMLASFTLGTAQLAHAVACENPDALTFAMIPTEESVAELQLYS